jgi:hypothetical protein
MVPALIAAGAGALLAALWMIRRRGSGMD